MKKTLLSFISSEIASASRTTSNYTITGSEGPIFSLNCHFLALNWTSKYQLIINIINSPQCWFTFAFRNESSNPKVGCIYNEVK